MSKLTEHEDSEHSKTRRKMKKYKPISQPRSKQQLHTHRGHARSMDAPKRPYAEGMGLMRQAMYRGRFSQGTELILVN